MTQRPAADLALAAERAAQFADLHQPGIPLLMANAWDAGSAKILAHLGYAALATTSAGFANSLGRHDGGVTRDEAIAHGADLAAATPLPVSADLEHWLRHRPGRRRRDRRPRCRERTRRLLDRGLGPARRR